MCCGRAFIPKDLRHIVNLAEWREHLLHRVRRIVELTADPGIAELATELESYPGPLPAAPETTARNEIMMPLRLRHKDNELSFFSTVATFGRWW